MKKSFLLIAALCLLIAGPATSQSRLLRRVANDVAGELLGTPARSTSGNTQPEPPSACRNPELIFELGSKKLVYSEVGIDVIDDGAILIQDRISGKYYLIRDGVSKGPFNESDPQVAPYINNETGDDNEGISIKYREFISKAGDKYQINFNGKTYGPYAQISSFAVTRSKDKFAAVVVENEAIDRDRAKMMEEAMKNAKTDQERMELTIKWSQEVQQNIMAGGGVEGMTPKLVSNIEGADFNPSMGGTLDGTIKYDDILVNKFSSLTDLKGNPVITLKQEHSMMQDIFVNSANTRYAVYNYGTITFSDGATISELFNPYLTKTGANVDLAYMYYSPAKNSIMQCRINF